MKILFCFMCGNPLRMAYPGNNPENGPAEMRCPSHPTVEEYATETLAYRALWDCIANAVPKIREQVNAIDSRMRGEQDPRHATIPFALYEIHAELEQLGDTLNEPPGGEDAPEASPATSEETEEPASKAHELIADARTVLANEPPYTASDEWVDELVGVARKAVDCAPEIEALELIAQGYEQVSRAHRMVARLPPGKSGLVAMLELAEKQANHAEWCTRMGEAQCAGFYRRVHARDALVKTLSPAVFDAFRRLGGRVAH